VCTTVRLVTSSAVASPGSRSSIRTAASRAAIPSTTPQRRAGSLTRDTTARSHRSTPLPSSTVITSTAAPGMSSASRYHRPAMPAPSSPIPQSIPIAPRGRCVAMNLAGSTPV